MLELVDVHTYYGLSHVLQGLSMKLGEDRGIAVLVGRNGAGKTTTLHSIVGFCPPRSGSVFFQGKNIAGFPAYTIAQLGISLVPQGRRIFSSLTVGENLEIAARRVDRENQWDMEKVLGIFPRLGERIRNRGHQLSGGEMQMLAIGRALMANPKLLLMDEPSEGLSIMLVRELGRIMQDLKEGGLRILLVEQNIHFALSVADYAHVLNKGRIVYESAPDKLLGNEEVKSQYLGV